MQTDTSAPLQVPVHFYTPQGTASQTGSATAALKSQAPRLVTSTEMTELIPSAFETRGSSKPASVPARRAGYDVKGNVAFVEEFTRELRVEGEKELVAACDALENDDKGAVSRQREAGLALGKLLKQLALVESGVGTFKDAKGENVKGSIDYLAVQDRQLTYYVFPEGKSTSQRCPSGIYEKRPARRTQPDEAGPLLSADEPAAATDAKAPRKSMRPARKDYDSAAMSDAFAGLHRHTQVRLELNLECAQALREELRQRFVDTANQRLAAFEEEKECVRIGHGWFETRQGWVEADVVGFEVVRRKRDEDVVVIKLKPRNRPEFAWDSGARGNCRADPPGRCCNIL